MPLLKSSNHNALALKQSIVLLHKLLQVVMVMASAAVMAIALSKDNSVVPQYVESNALKSKQVLSPTIGTLGLGMIKAMLRGTLQIMLQKSKCVLCR